MLIEPCTSVHTFFMRFPIDVVYLDRDDVVVKLVDNLRPFRMSAGGRGARRVIELPAGFAKGASLRVGERLRIDR